VLYTTRHICCSEFWNFSKIIDVFTFESHSSFFACQQAHAPAAEAFPVESHTLLQFIHFSTYRDTCHCWISRKTMCSLVIGGESCDRLLIALFSLHHASTAIPRDRPNFAMQNILTRTRRVPYRCSSPPV
jgi:hypothetical protein